MKKIWTTLCICALAFTCAFGFTACGNVARDEIVVAQREAGSGTRDAFESIFSLKNEVVASVDYNSTGVLKTFVAGDTNAIGYVSLGSLDSSVKAVKIDGEEASEKNILDKKYIAARPFNLVTKKGATLSTATQDFIKYIYSNEGQNAVKGASLIKAQTEDGATGKAYDTPKNSIAESTITISGSTSMEDVVLRIAESYKGIQSNVEIKTSFQGSSAGKSDVKSDKADIGLVSSALSEKDIESLDGHKMATDGLAIIVHKDNAIANLTTELVQKIFKGEIKVWSQVK